MCWRCASLSVTLPGVADFCSSDFGEQPTSRTARADAASTETIKALGRGGRGNSLFILVPVQFGAMPPAAAQGLEQGRRVGIAAGLGLEEGDARLLIGLF